MPIGFDGSSPSTGRTADININAIRQILNQYYVNEAGDTNVGTLSMANGATITNLPNPTEATDAADKAYVDSQVASITTYNDSRYLQLAGGTMMGNIAMSGNNITGLADPINPQDELLRIIRDNSFIKRAGDTMSGTLTVPAVTGSMQLYNITFTTASVTGYTVNLLIGESNGATGSNFNLNDDSTTFPSGANSVCSFAFGSNGSNTYAFYVESVSGTAPNRVANVWVNLSNLNFNSTVTITLNNKFTGTSLQSGANTFIFFDNFTGTVLNSSLWGYSTNVVVNNGVSIGSATTRGSLLTTTNNPFSDNIEFITSVELANTAWSYVGFGFRNFSVENIWQQPGHSFIANGIHPATIKSIAKLNSSHYQRVRLARVGTSGRVIVENIVTDVTLPAPQATDILFAAYDTNTYTRVQYVFVRKFATVEPTFSSLATSSILMLPSNINLNNSSISSVANPVNPQDAATKYYVDTNILNQATTDARYLQLTGGTMTGAINMGNQRITDMMIGSITNPTDAASMANINAVVNIICGTQGGIAVPCLRKDGIIGLSGTLTMNNNRIATLANPIADSDALNRITGDTRYQMVRKIIRTTQTVGSSSSGLKASTFTISNSAFTSKSLGQILLTPLAQDYNDCFAMSIRSAVFSDGLLTLKINTQRVDENLAWGQNLLVNILIILN